MPLSHLPAFLTTAFASLARWLDKRSAARLPLLLAGILLARNRRTVTSWLRAAGITVEFRRAYSTVHAVGRAHQDMAFTLLQTVRPLLEPDCLRVAIDDTPTSRYGRHVEGAGIHHNPSPGPAGEEHVCGHVWVTLAALASHPDWGTIALPLLGSLYIRRIDTDKPPRERARPFRTKLAMAVEQLAWLQSWVGHRYERRWVVTDGGYAKRPFLKGAKRHGFTVISRLRKAAALLSLPLPKPASRRGPQATYGKKRISLAKRAAAKGGWQQVECMQYGETVTKAIKTFLATWRPAGGVIRVVLVLEDDDWLPYFAVGAEVSAVEILEAMADRGALEQTNKDVKEVWGAAEQQVRNVFCNEGCFNLNLWMYSLVEAWAWNKKRSWWTEAPARGTASRGVLLMPTSARRCSVRCCSGKSTRLCPAGPTRGRSASWRSGCCSRPHERPIRPHSATVSSSFRPLYWGLNPESLTESTRRSRLAQKRIPPSEESRREFVTDGCKQPPRKNRPSGEWEPALTLGFR